MPGDGMAGIVVETLLATSLLRPRKPAPHSSQAVKRGPLKPTVGLSVFTGNVLRFAQLFFWTDPQSSKSVPLPHVLAPHQKFFQFLARFVVAHRFCSSAVELIRDGVAINLEL